MSDTPAAVDRSRSAIAPDTTGLNFYRGDPSLADLLDIYVAPICGAISSRISSNSARPPAAASTTAPVSPIGTRRSCTPQSLRRRCARIEYHPAYRELEAAGFGQFGIHAMSHRGGILGWPKPYTAAAKHAFTYLFNQTEFGMGCPLNVTDGAAMLLDRYGDAALKAKLSRWPDDTGHDAASPRARSS